MKKLAVFAIVVAAGACQAQVTSIGPFPTNPIWMEGFDTTAQGAYNNLPVFGTPAVAQRIGAGQLIVRPWPGVVSAPHLMVGDGADVRIITQIPMRRFGGFFKSGFFGAFSTTATFVFFDVAGNMIGSPQIVPLTPNSQWIGFMTVPKWRRVEIYGNVPGLPGIVGMDSLRIRPN